MEFLPLKGDSLIEHRIKGKSPYMLATLERDFVADDGEHMPEITLSLIFLSENDFANNYEYDPSFRRPFAPDAGHLRVIRKKRKNGISEARRQLQLTQDIQEDLSWELANNSFGGIE